MNHFRMSLTKLSLLAIVLLAVACGTVQVGVEPGAPSQQESQVTPEASPSPAETQEPQPTAATGPVLSTPTPPAAGATASLIPTPSPEPASPLWVTYRDPQYGYGLAIPCYWVIYSAHGLSIRSYDEDFAMANSIRGSWKDGQPPAGAYNPDIGVFDYSQSGIAPGTSVADAIPQLISDDIASVEEVAFGRQVAYQANLVGDGSPDYFANLLYFFELTPGRLLMVAPKWQNALESSDMQAILSSLALSAEEEVMLPAFPPAGPVDGRQLYINQEAGYCFQYPSEFTLEEFAPVQPMSLGQIATLKLERPLYTVGLTVDVQRVAAQTSLADYVTGYAEQFASQPSAAIRRNPPELVGGIDFQLGGEPSELLEDVPGPEGSRDLFAIHGDRLFHLTFTPSVLSNPQAAQDVGLLYNVISSSFTFLPLE